MLRFNSRKLSKSQKPVNYWQVLEQKSAYTEGFLASEVLFLNSFANYKITAKLFWSKKSPLEKTLSKLSLSPIKTELDYIEQRVNLISKFQELLKKYPVDSDAFGEIENALWLLRFQLYGFGQQLLFLGKVLYGLIAIRESGALEKEPVKLQLKKIAQEQPKFASLIAEFI